MKHLVDRYVLEGAATLDLVIISMFPVALIL